MYSWTNNKFSNALINKLQQVRELITLTALPAMLLMLTSMETSLSSRPPCLAIYKKTS